VRALTVRQALENLRSAVIALVMVLFVGLNFGLFLLSRVWRASLITTLKTASSTQVVLIVVLLLVVLDLILIAAALKRFQRTQLILD